MASTSCRQGCWEAFNQSNFGLDHDNPELFVTSQWQSNSLGWRIVYLIYRILVAMFWFVILILSGVLDLGWYTPNVDGLLWFVYLTNWGLFILTIDANLQAFTCMYRIVKNERWHRFDSGLKMVWYLKIQWIISNISLSVGFLITIASGILFYSVSFPLHYVDVSSHLVNTIYLFFNLFISATPIRVYHAIHPMAFCLLYITVSVILKYTANITAYPGINMDDPETLAMSILIGAILSIAVLWLFIYGLYRARLAMAEACTRSRTRQQLAPKPQSVVTVFNGYYYH